MQYSLIRLPVSTAVLFPTPLLLLVIDFSPFVALLSFLFYFLRGCTRVYVRILFCEVGSNWRRPFGLKPYLLELE